MKLCRRWEWFALLVCFSFFLVIVLTILFSDLAEGYIAYDYDDISVLLYPDNYSAYSYDNITVILDVLLGDTCTTFSLDGLVSCSDNCTISNNYDLGGMDLKFSGHGTIFVTSNITGVGDIFINGLSSSQTCDVIILRGSIE